MVRRVRRKEGENLDDATIAKVVASLDANEPISKKEACDILNIAYNTKRLSNIIESWRTDQEVRRTMRASLRGKPTSIDEEKEIVSSYLRGDSIAEIEKYTYRSKDIIEKVVHKYNVPKRSRGEYNYFSPPFVPDEGVKEDYQPGDLVFAARYNTPATVEKVLKIDPEHGTIYKLWIHGDYARFATQPFYELGDLREAQKKLNIKVEDIPPEEIKRLVYEAWVNSKKGKKSDD
jgi:hypothetical protein